MPRLWGHPLQEYFLRQTLTSSNQLHVPEAQLGDSHAGWAAVIFLDHLQHPGFVFVFPAEGLVQVCSPLTHPQQGPSKEAFEVGS